MGEEIKDGEKQIKEYGNKLEQKLGIFAIRSEGNNVTNRIVGSNGVRNARNERPPLRESEIAKQIKDGKKQVKEYGNLRLQKFVVAALGFERVCFRLVNGVGS